MTLVNQLQLSPDGVDVELARLTCPVKLLRDVRVIVDVPEPPARIWLGLTVAADIEKSAAAVTWKVILAVVCERVPLFAVTVTE